MEELGKKGEEVKEKKKPKKQKLVDNIMVILEGKEGRGR